MSSLDFLKISVLQFLFFLTVNQKLLAMKLENIRQIVAIQLDAFCSKLNAITGPKKKPAIAPKVIPTMHSEEPSLIPNTLEKIGVNIASATAQIPLKIIKKSIDFIIKKNNLILDRLSINNYQDSTI